ncbi:MAG: phosphatase PAP2 family protein [Aliidongia sp.]
MPTTTDRRGLIALVSAAVLIPASVEFADRAVSTWSFTTLHRPDAFIDLTLIIEPLPPIAGILLALAGLAALAGWRPGHWGRVMIATCVALLVAVTLKEQLKYAFGRTWPETWVNNNPSWIGDGTYGFFPFHKGPGWASFPSGHMTVITAPIGVLWGALPRLRIVWLALPIVVAVGLIGADYHFLGDIIAGSYLGTASGIGIAAAMAIGRKA